MEVHKVTAMKRGTHHRLPEPLTASEEERAKEARRAYMRSYMAARYRRNPELQRQSNLRYWLRKADQMDNAEGGQD